jgi:hypothetical protein
MPRGASHEVLGSYSTCRRRSPLAARDRRNARSLPPGLASPGSFRPQGFDPPDGLLLRRGIDKSAASSRGLGRGSSRRSSQPCGCSGLRVLPLPRPRGSRAISPRLYRLPTVFQVGALMEFLTLQSFLLVRSRGASRRSLPSCHSPSEPSRAAVAPMLRGARGAAVRTGWMRRGFKALLPGARALPWHGASPPAPARCSPGFRAPSGYRPPRPRAVCLHPASSRELSSDARAGSRLAPLHHARAPRLPGVFTRSGLATPRGAADPPGVHHLIDTLHD